MFSRMQPGRMAVAAICGVAAISAVHAPPAIDNPRDAFTLAVTDFLDTSADPAADEPSRLRTALERASRAIGAREATPRTVLRLTIPVHDRQLPLAIYAAGVDLLLQGEARRGIDELRASLAHDPLVTDFGITSTFARQGIADLRARATDAVARFEEALDWTPDSSEVRRLLGLAWRAAHRNDRSIEQLQAAVELNPKNERAWLALADVLKDAGRIDRAESELRAALALLPSSAQAKRRLSVLTSRPERGRATAPARAP